LLGYLGLGRVGDVEDDAAFQHLCEAGLQPIRGCCVHVGLLHTWIALSRESGAFERRRGSAAVATSPRIRMPRVISAGAACASDRRSVEVLRASGRRLWPPA